MWEAFNFVMGRTRRILTDLEMENMLQFYIKTITFRPLLSWFNTRNIYKVPI